MRFIFKWVCWVIDTSSIITVFLYLLIQAKLVYFLVLFNLLSLFLYIRFLYFFRCWNRVETPFLTQWKHCSNTFFLHCWNSVETSFFTPWKHRANTFFCTIETPSKNILFSPLKNLFLTLLKHLFLHCCKTVETLFLSQLKNCWNTFFTPWKHRWNTFLYTTCEGTVRNYSGKNVTFLEIEDDLKKANEMFPVHKAVNLYVCPMSIVAIRSVKTSSTPKIRLSREEGAYFWKKFIVGHSSRGELWVTSSA